MRIPVWFVAAVVVVVSMLTGVVVGVAVDRRMLFHRGGGPFVLSRSRWHGPMVPDRMEHELGLTPAQSAAVDSVMRYRMAQRDSVMAHTFPVMRALLDSTRVDIEKVLTPDQRKKFETMRFHDRPIGVTRMRGSPDEQRSGVIVGGGDQRVFIGPDAPPPPPPQ